MTKETTFKAAYQSLNRQQRQAVDNIFGPLLVVAGPGTGKTQLLAIRVGQILLKTDTDPSNILCLTFTNKAALNMRERLISLIGIEARDVYARTFHSFAAEIMNLYPDYFWNGAALRIAPEALQVEIISNILGELPLKNPLALKFAGRYTLVNDVTEALKLAKEAGLTPDKLRALVKINLGYIDLIEKDLVDMTDGVLSSKKLKSLQQAVDKLPRQAIEAKTVPLISLSTIIKESLTRAINLDEDSGKTKNVSNWKTRWVQTLSGKKGLHKERARNEWWLAIADVYDRYRQQMHSRGYYDYADMLVEVIGKLEQHPQLLADVQERFLYVLIDEFQDTNAAQIRLAHLVADNPTSEGQPNLMVVGDDDQAIYKFQGAELNNMLSFLRAYPTAKQVVLSESYRSTQAIIDTAAKIIVQAKDRLVKRVDGLKKDLRAQPDKTQGTIEHQIYPTREHQFSAIASQIKKIKGSRGSTAVLARGHDSLRKLAAILLSKGVPVRYEQQANILDNEAVKQAVTMAELLTKIAEGDGAQVDFLLAQTLRHPMWGLDKTKLWHLALSKDSQSWLDALLRHKEKSFKAIGQFLLWLSNESTNQPLSLILEYILGLRAGPVYTSPLKNYFIDNKRSDYLHTISALQLLRALSDELAAAAEASLGDFVRLIKVARDNNKPISDESPFVSKADAVWLYTVHKAKGLEFDRVFVIDAIEDNWRPRPGRRKPPANLPLQPHGDDEDDFARLMFVAASRARRSLIFTSYKQDHAGHELLATPLVRGAIEKAVEIGPEKFKDTVAVLEENLRWPRLKAIDEKETLKARLEEYSLSVTGLLNFMDVSSGGPQYFLERNLLRLPEVKTPSLAFGTAIHSAMDYAQKQINKQTFNLRQTLREFKLALSQEHLPASDFGRYLLHGQDLLRRLFKELRYKLPPGSLSEQRITDVKVGQATLSGKLDRIDGADTPHLTIIDYKTGAPLANLSSQSQSQAIKAYKQRTQLIFYSLLAKNSPRFKRAREIIGEMVYLEAQNPKQLVRSYQPNDVEIERLARLINKVWPKIIGVDLPDARGYEKNFAGVMQFEEDLLTDKI